MHTDRSQMDVSNLDYSKYTDESVWEESFEVDQKMDTLLTYNQYLITGFGNFMDKDIGGLIRSYEQALITLEKGKTPNHQENLVTIKSNLGIAYYFNNELDKAIYHNEDALRLVQQGGRSMDRQLETIQSLYIKILCNLIVFRMVKKEDREATKLAQALIEFLNSMYDAFNTELILEGRGFSLRRPSTSCSDWSLSQPSAMSTSRQ